VIAAAAVPGWIRAAVAAVRHHHSCDRTPPPLRFFQAVVAASDILCPYISAVFNGKMDTEKPDNVLASPRSEAMRKAWATRKALAAAEAAWFEYPVCLCGCGEALVRHKTREKQRFFRVGHDAKLKSVAGKVMWHEADRAAIPQIARTMKAHLVFLQKDSELAKAF